jgi:RNA polymerase sigma factor (sigma-70 family)
MRSGRARSAASQWHRLFRGGTIVGLTEAQLLERFLNQRDEIAFEALVSRHGPMVLSVCRRLLNDPADVDDAFQATFLVFVRRAATIRDRRRLGSWLYGVAHRIAGRARQEAARRRSREMGDVETLPDRRHAPPPNEDLALLHEEVRRLPEKYRAVLVLCDLESQSHEDAARQLNWPVGSVKGRLFRARNLLRGRLERRGVSLSAGAIVAALGGEARGAIVAPALLDATVQTGIGFATGQTVAAGLVSAASVALFQGVHHAMLLSKLKIAGALVAAGVVVAGTGALAHQKIGAGEDGKSGAVAPSAQPPRPADETPPIATDDSGSQTKPDSGQALAKQFREVYRDRTTAAKQMFEANRAFYENGKITIDRVIDASRKLAEAEQESEQSTEKKLQSAEAHVERMKALVKREKAKLDIGTGSLPNYGEAVYAASDAELHVAQLTNLKGSPEGERDEVKQRTQAAIEGRLKLIFPMPFGQPTPLRDVIKYVTNATVTPDLPVGLPIFVDWQVLEKVQQAEVVIDVDGIPLGKAFEAVLRQVELGYSVRDGLLLITSIESKEYLNWRSRQDEAKRKVPFPDTIFLPKAVRK